MAHPNSGSLVWRLGCVLVIVHVIALVTWTMLSVRRVESASLDHETARLRTQAEELATRYATLLTSSDDDNNEGATLDHVQRQIEQDAAITGLFIAIAREDGDTLVSEDGRLADPANAWFRAVVSASVRFGAFASSVRGDAGTSGTANLWGAIPLTVNGTVDHALLLAVPTQSRIAHNAAWVMFGLVALGSVLVCVMVIAFMHTRYRSAVSRLSVAAEAYGRIDLTHRVDLNGMRDLAEPGRALNEMAHEIDNQVQILHARRNEQDAILQSMGNGVIALDLDRRVLNLNRAAAAILGGSAETSRGRLLHEITRHPELHEFVEDAMAEPESTRSEIRIHDAFPPTVLEIRSKPLLDARQRAAGLLIILEDVTELRRLERIRTDFAANVSHELRTPITNIKGYLETIDEIGFSDEAQSRRFLGIIQTNADRLGSIIEDLLALARLESRDEKDQLPPTRVPVGPVVQTVVDQVRTAAERKQIQITTSVEPDLHIFAVSQLIEQALSNLLSNAIKYSPARTHVEVSATRTDDGMVSLAVKDEGPGIAPEHHERLFERFYRVDKARSRELGGTGLGLAIVKHIAQVHGGTVTLTSAVGAGSRFEIQLPMAPDAPDLSESDADADAG